MKLDGHLKETSWLDKDINVNWTNLKKIETLLNKIHTPDNFIANKHPININKLITISTQYVSSYPMND